MKVKHPDVVQIAETTSDGYGDKTVTILSEINATFLQGTISSHTENVDLVESDAHIYLDIDNEVLTDRGYRIEGMYIVADPFSAGADESWYRITRVIVGQRKLLNNAVNNVHAFLRKVAKPNVQIVS